MRIISQDGSLDFPYENSAVFFSTRHYGGNVVVAQLIGDTEADTLAKYSTKEKAIKAMELLREVYLYHTSISVKNGNANGAIKFARVFQFPNDDEIEV